MRDKRDEVEPEDEDDEEEEEKDSGAVFTKVTCATDQDNVKLVMDACIQVVMQAHVCPVFLAFLLAFFHRISYPCILFMFYIQTQYLYAPHTL